LEEIATAPERFGWPAPPALDTIYLGGGTPSLMGPAAIGAVLDQLRTTFAVAPAAEITLEVNPTTAEAAQLDQVLALGVGRLSVGCQSFSDRVLARLGRVHDAATTRQAIRRMRELGVANLSLDLIFGAPTQTLADFENDLREILAFAPEHVSAYNMTVHEGTPFARWQREGRLGLPEEDDQVTMFEALMDRLAEAGYEHYEISNWARPGRVSRHNSKYWRDCDVYGFGVAAHGVERGRRFANPSDLRAYLDPARRELAEPLPPPAGERARCGEVMMLALRRTQGVGWEEINPWMGRDARQYYAAELEQAREDGLIEDYAQTLRLTRRGILVSDSVMEMFF
jgi:oxygen-independent coproporphyrinogen-3 oxidase